MSNNTDSVHVDFLIAKCSDCDTNDCCNEICRDEVLRKIKENCEKVTQCCKWRVESEETRRSEEIGTCELINGNAKCPIRTADWIIIVAVFGGLIGFAALCFLVIWLSCRDRKKPQQTQKPPETPRPAYSSHTPQNKPQTPYQPYHNPYPPAPMPNVPDDNQNNQPVVVVVQHNGGGKDSTYGGGQYGGPYPGQYGGPSPGQYGGPYPSPGGGGGAPPAPPAYESNPQLCPPGHSAGPPAFDENGR
uniref:Uncharacterized protein n=1 Tax=Chromera velia CCMP2878 TaxID=1169474 RepID=A0A0G4HVA1_9ALVE|eukprot:Cvel_32173.t1-p1 / transcript=Cvel_32173.t1 / gene=Cvel_32173 / organism=Chromera_velia_CCMP2878 / gene_product=hypothetical protein / transcript_product=hypothetical protein / location=Cvel_scaffold4942:2870-3954(-) / protein_length=245 / sequence_SO=supercontig / SO=protein_coding / is_pseudo=false